MRLALLVGALLLCTTSVASASELTQTVPFGAAGRIKITVERLQDPVTHPAVEHPMNGPAKPGSRYLAIHIRVANVSESTYRSHLYSSIDNHPRLYGSDSTVVELDVIREGWGCDVPTITATLQPGEVRRGCLLFALRRSVRPDTLEMGSRWWVLTSFDPVKRRRPAQGPERRRMIDGSGVAQVLQRLPPRCARVDNVIVAERFPRWGFVHFAGIPPVCGASISDVISVRKIDGRWRRHQFGNGGGCRMPTAVREDLRLHCW